MYYTPSNLEAAVARFVGGFTQGMDRMPFVDFISKLAETADYLFPEAESLRESTKRAIKAKIAKTIIEEVSGSRSCTLSGNYGDSVSVTLSWGTIALTGQISRKQHQDNEIKLQEAIAKRMADLRRSLLTELNTLASAWFEANKSTVNDATSYGTFDAGTNVFEIEPTLAVNPGFLNIAEQMMRENRWQGLYDMIVNGYTWPQLRYYANQGAGNNANTAFQFQNWMLSNGLGYSDANYPNYFGYAFQQNSVGALFWLPEDYRNPRDGQSVADNLGVKSVVPDPEIPNLNWAVKMKLECKDTTSYNGNDDDEVLYVQMSTDYSFNYAQTEDGSTPILAIGSEEAAA